MNSIPKEAEECWFHSCAGHYCVRHSWTEECTYPNCHERDYKGNPYYIHKKTKEDDDEYQIRIEKLIGDSIEHIRKEEEQYRKDQEEIKRLEKRLRKLKSKKQ